MRHLLIAALIATGCGAPAAAAPCKDAKGKFVKCPPAPKKAERCKDARGRFVKCGSSDAKPA